MPVRSNPSNHLNSFDALTCFDCAPSSTTNTIPTKNRIRVNTFNPRIRVINRFRPDPRIRLAPRNRPQAEDPFFSQLIKTAEKISLVVLGIVSAATNIYLFLPFFIAGAAYGIYKYSKEGTVRQLNCNAAGCSQGFLEEITGIRLPRAVSLVANVAATICHIEHHQEVFVPLTAINCGSWAGFNGAQILKNSARSFNYLYANYFSPQHLNQAYMNFEDWVRINGAHVVENSVGLFNNLWANNFAPENTNHA